MSITCKLCGNRGHDATDSSLSHGSSNNAGAVSSVVLNGKSPSGESVFVCPTCLARIARIWSHFRRRFRVTSHAIERFVERRVEPQVSERDTRTAIGTMFMNSKRVVFTEEIMRQRRRRNHDVPAAYHSHGEWIFVTTQQPPFTIVTAERTWGRRLGRDFWYAVEDDFAPTPAS